MAVFSVAQAQTTGTLPPAYLGPDENGVDPVAGTYNFQMVEAAIGDTNAPLTLMRIYGGAGWSDNWSGALYSKTVSGVNTVSVVFGGVTDSFVRSGTTYIAQKADGSSLTLNVAGDLYTYTSRDGTKIQYQVPYDVTIHTITVFSAGACQSTNASLCALPVSITRPDGYSVTLAWETPIYCIDWEECRTARMAYRLTSVTDSRGYSITFAYQSGGSSVPPAATWYRRTTATLKNNNIAGCNGTTILCTQTVTYGYPATGQTTVTDAAGRQWRFTIDSAGVHIKRPSSATDNINVGIGVAGVTSVSDGTGTWSYARTVTGTTVVTTVTDPLSNTRQIIGDLTVGRATSFKDGLGKITTHMYDTAGRLTRTTAPEGNYVQYVYDARGNVTGSTRVSKTPGTPANVITSASYPASCANPVTCNKPTSTTDARNNVTDYSYDATTGLVTSVTAPAATVPGVRPEVRYGYGAVGSGALTRLTSVSTCRTTASCTGTADEVKTTIAYGASGASRALPTSITSGSGDGALAATTSLAYDNFGQVASADGPLAGTADTTAFFYDSVRQPTGVVGPDPDGAGPLKHRAQRVTYNPDGQPTLVETGTTNGQGAGDWAAFAMLQKSVSAYDAAGRKRTEEVHGNSGGAQAVTQYSYDALSRPECMIVRMNAAQFGALPANPTCANHVTGSFGPDRITKTTYDAAGQVTKVTSAYGTAEASDDVIATYYPNGTQATLADANGNLTTYEYDGLDRLVKTRYPIAGSGGVSSATDYDGLSYDPAGNVTQRRLRDGQTIGYGYDNLNRMTLMDRSGAGIDHDVGYTYDLQGRLLTSANAGGHYANYAYDGLGRVVGETTTYGGTKTSQYDLAGRRTRLTWYDGFYVTYDHHVTGEVTAIRENGAGSGIGVLASYGYDDLGRRVSLVRGNGTVTSYGYDPVSRLASLTQDLGGTAYDQSVGFTYNPASQIASATRGNDVYAWNGHYDVDRLYGVNGLNQLTSAGATALGYDGRGNLTSSGSAAYGYTQLNQLYAAPGATLFYNPAGGLDLVHTGAGGTTYDYDGANLATQWDYNSGTMLRRYVFGPGIDEPLVEYSGAGLATRQFHHADERGSVVALSDAWGSAVQINRYDEYGIPASGNAGTFQYTGQVWVPEIGMYYYKARMYSPTLGRFMQTDPIGYGDGPNWYNYVGSDPVNKVDPLGLEQYCRMTGGSSGYSNWGWTVTGSKLSCSGPVNIDRGAGNTVGEGGGSSERQSKKTPQRTQTPTPCQRAFLKDQLGSRGLPTSQIDNLKFVSGLDSNANALTRSAFNGGAGAVTQGSTVYVQPGGFDTVANFRSATGFEEAYHTAQFASNRGFYTSYGLLSLGGLLSMGDSYNGNMYEAFAKGAARQMFEASKAGMCPQ